MRDFQYSWNITAVWGRVIYSQARALGCIVFADSDAAGYNRTYTQHTQMSESTIMSKLFQQGPLEHGHQNTEFLYATQAQESQTWHCEVCQKAFASRSNLNRHFLIHTGEKRYKCSICGKAFTQKVILDAHVRTHTGERPYKCEWCTQAFAQSSTLRGHMVSCKYKNGLA